MAELINKWDAVSKLVHLENEYNFFKWDAETLYRNLCQVEIAIAKMPCTRWIPVEECLPEHNVEPVHDIDGIHHMLLSDFVVGYTDRGQIAVVQHEIGDHRDWWMDWNCNYYTITHWMPLPVPPKRGNGNA